MINLHNKTILITGASSGIGRACAVLCSQLGARVALVGRNEERLASAIAEMAGDGHAVFPADLADVDALEGLVTRIVERMGPLDGFVHSAGMSLNRPFKLLKPTQHQEVYTLNVISGFEIVRALQKRGRYAETGCSLVFIASVMAIMAEKAKTAYCASKAALVNGSRVLALESAKSGFRVNCVSPGMVQTEMLDRLTARLDSDAWAKIVEAHPLGVGAVDDVANAVCFLLSDAARWITGTNMIVDGGYSCK